MLATVLVGLCALALAVAVLATRLYRLTRRMDARDAWCCHVASTQGRHSTRLTHLEESYTPGGTIAALENRQLDMADRLLVVEERTHPCRRKE